MTEQEAQDWLRNRFDVSRETWDRLELFLSHLRDEMDHQNLISRSSAQHIWTRHVMDSAQLLALLPDRKPPGIWLDLGTGAGFPGIIAAILSDHQVHMVESRARRVDFLERALGRLNLSNAKVLGKRLENIDSFPADVISARAFAPLDRLIALSHRFSTEKTVWLLPKGKNAVREMEDVAPKWRKMFHVEQSLTDPDAGILVGNVNV